MIPFRAALLSGAAAIAPVVSGVGDYAVVTRAAAALTVGKVPWDSQLFGDAGLFDNANDRLLAPGTASFVRVMGYLESFALYTVRKNGLAATFPGCARMDAGGEDLSLVPFQTAILPCAPGDYFEAQLVNNNNTPNANNYFAIERLNYTPRYCHAVVGTNNSSIVNSWAAINWNGADVTDADNMHDPVATPHIFTVPAGGPHLVRVSCQMKMTQTGRHIMILTNPAASAAILGACLQSKSAGAVANTMTSAIMSLASGTQLSVWHWSFDGGNTGQVLAGDESWLQVEILPPETKYVLLTRNFLGSQANGTRINFNVTSANTAGATISGDGAITVPAGVTKARMWAQIRPNAGCNIYCRKNGVFAAGYARRGSNMGDNWINTAAAPWIAVVAGDVLDVGMGGSASLASDVRTWFCVEFE